MERTVSASLNLVQIVTIVPISASLARARAKDADIGTIVTICTKLSEADTVRSIAETYENVWCTVGVHPH